MIALGVALWFVGMLFAWPLVAVNPRKDEEVGQ
jgi:hypothetical protein